MLAEAANATTNRSTVLAALQQAASETGADFQYLLNTATRESGLNPSAQAGTSSAAGLFQFVEQTWMSVVKTYGAKHGLASFANAITRGTDGRLHADNAADRAAILALRKNPQVASVLEGEFTQANRASLEGSLGRNVCGGELYIAHFLGNDAGCRLIRMNDSQPNAAAANAFPAAADANRNVFYHADGSPKSVREVYNWALRQPQGSTTLNTVPVRPGNTPAPATVVNTDYGATPDTDSLLASFTSWSPNHGFFKSDDGDGNTSTAPFLLTPAVMDVLSSLHPASNAAHS